MKDLLFSFQGFDMWTKLRQICFYTPNRALREYLIVELEQNEHLTEEEKGMIAFVHKLEQLYSCPSFEMAKILRMESSPRYMQSTVKRHYLEL